MTGEVDLSDDVLDAVSSLVYVPQMISAAYDGNYAAAQEALAGAIESLLGQPVDRGAMAARHRDRFSWERQAATILGLLSRTDAG